ncbi:hypothetical protein ACJRO7_027359 [Eucalyptus globulus]|uniref:Uncharacterized protein n=1 Tax=Eucalyptus globulus TaxID=34317 RepID=A0ABD3JTH7_EUCGL
MAATVVNTKLLLLKQAKRDRRCTSALTMTKKLEKSKPQMSGGDQVDEPDEDRQCWVPHPRTGIYVPRGQERVVDNIPEGAASSCQAFWFRSVEGVDRPDPDEPTRRGSSFSR